MANVVNNLQIQKDNVARIENALRKELLSVSKPLDLMQAFYVLSMYRVRDGFIIPNSVFYNVVSGIWSLLLLVSYFYSIFKHILTDELDGLNFVEFSCSIGYLVTYSYGNVASYFTNVIQKHNNVRLAISIQNVCEMINENGKSLKNFTLLNWVYVFALLGYRIFWIMGLNIAFPLVLPFDETLKSLLYNIFDIKLLYAFRLIKLLSESLRTWIDDAWNSIFVEDVDSDLYWDKKFRVYMEIAETYEIVGKIFQTLFLYYCVETFTNGVLSVWICIEMAKVVNANVVKVSLSLLSLIWMVKSMSLVTALCLEFERFYSVMTEVRNACIQLSASEICPEAQKRVCKNIQRVQTATFKKMSACGLFVIDAVLPLLLFSLLTTHIIVVLQFEFL